MTVITLHVCWEDQRCFIALPLVYLVDITETYKE